MLHHAQLGQMRKLKDGLSVGKRNGEKGKRGMRSNVSGGAEGKGERAQEDGREQEPKEGNRVKTN